MEALQKHFREHGPEQLFLKTDCDILLPSGAQIIAIYAMPKYTLSFGSNRDALKHVIELGRATTLGHVSQAAQSNHLTYDIYLHIRLRHRYVSILVFADGTVIDEHKHWMQGDGQSEHSWSVASLLNLQGYHEILAQHKRGPVNSRPKKGPKHVVAPKRSEELKKMLEPTSQETVEPEGVAASSPTRACLPALNASGSQPQQHLAPVAPLKREANHEPAGEVRPDPSSCLARIWNDGAGGQCGRRHKTSGTEFCGRHATETKRSLGRVDGPIPDSKKK